MKSRTQQEFIKRWEEVLQGTIMRGYVSQVYDETGKTRDAATVLRMMAQDALRLRERLQDIWQYEIEASKPPTVNGVAAQPKGATR